MNKVLLIVALVLGRVALAIELVPASEVQVRKGVGNFIEKVKGGQSVKVAYLGGSITEMDGWRRLSREWLQSRYPSASIAEIAAAVSGSGSGLGVYRIGQDVLAHDPDLLFVEFATNDANAAPESIWRNFDGIVRQTWRRNPNTDIVFVYTVTAATVADYAAGKCPLAASAMEMLAEHYGIPSICFGPRVAADASAGTLVMNHGETATPVPAESQANDESLADWYATNQGKRLFSKDGVHPILRAHNCYYLESIKAAWAELEKKPDPIDHAPNLGAAYYDATYEKAKLVSIEPAMMMGDWRQVAANEKNGSFASRLGGKLWLAESPGAKLKFRIKGNECGLYGLIGPDCGQCWVTIDGKRGASPKVLFDSYCTYYRLANIPVFGGNEGLHEVEIELDSEQPSRTAVSESSTNPAKYNGTTWYVGQLMVLGDPVERMSRDLNSRAWFDARVEDCVVWPRDAAFAWGGAWDATAASRASVEEVGALSVSADTSEISFCATQSKSLEGGGVRSMTFEASLDFEEFEPGLLPAVDPDWKGGVLVVREASGELRYYGLVRNGSANDWKPLSGPVVRTDGRPAAFQMTIKPSVEGVLLVNYRVDGVECTYGGNVDIPVVGSRSVSDVVLGGNGTLRSLFALAEPCRNGLVFVVR